MWRWESVPASSPLSGGQSHPGPARSLLVLTGLVELAECGIGQILQLHTHTHNHKHTPVRQSTGKKSVQDRQSNWEQERGGKRKKDQGKDGLAVESYLRLVLLLSHWLGQYVHLPPTTGNTRARLLQRKPETQNTIHSPGAPEWALPGPQGERMNQEEAYLGVRISLYWSFSTRVVAATDMGITMLLMSNELSPRLLLMGCCWGRGTTLLSLFNKPLTSGYVLSYTARY